MKHIVIDARNRRSSTGRYTDMLLEYLQKKPSNFQYTVLVLEEDPWDPKDKNFKRVACSFKQFSLSPIEQIRFAVQLYKLKPDLVHFTMPQQPLLFFGNKVTTLHDLTFLKYPRNKSSNYFIFIIKKILYIFLLKASTRSSAKIIVPSIFVKDALISFIPSLGKKVSVIYEAAETKHITKAQPLKDVRKPFIFHVGSPLPHKNIENLLVAYTEIKNSNPDVQLVLAGKKEFYFNKLQKVIDKHPFKESIVAPGLVNDNELSWLYKNCEAYILPSLSEGFGLPGLEAMVHGAPVVSSNATCLPEVYGNAALFFNPENTEDISLKIERILSDTELRKDLIKKGYSQVKKYSWKKMAEETLGVYTKLLDK